MKKFFLAILLLSVIVLNTCNNSSSGGADSIEADCKMNNSTRLVISEIVARSHIPDYLNGNDWIELRNIDSEPVNLIDFSIKNGTSRLVKLPDIILQPGQFFVIPASGPDTPHSGYSLPFELSKQDSVVLYSGSTQLDCLTWKAGEAKKGRSYGRLNGSVQTLYPTPLRDNVPYILFSDSEVFTVKIRTSDRNWQHLLRNPIQEYWYPAHLEFNGAFIEDIHFRTKGSSSERFVAELDSNHRSYGRYSFKLKFNKKKNQKFMGMKRLVFNNGYGDPTLMRDTIAYRLMKEVGAPASEVSYIDLWINDKHLGLYQMIEPVDGEYVEKYFPDDKKNGFKGDLYKAFCSLEWEPGQTLKDYTTGRFPQLELKTNRETIGTEHEGKALMAFLQSINSGSADLIDTDCLVRYIAAMTLISNYDSYFANLGNYYLYEHRSVNGFAMLPWDFNLGLGRSIKEGKKCEDPVVLIDHPTIKPLSQRPIIARVLERAELREKYHAHLETLLTNIFNPEDMRAFVQKKRELIDQYVKADPTGFYSYDSWKKSFTEIPEDGTDSFGRAGALLPYVDARYENVRQQLDGKIPSSGNGPCP